MHQLLQIYRHRDAEQHAGTYAEEPNQAALHDEYRQNAARRRAEGAQDGDVAALVFHHHDHGRDDVECGNGHHQRSDKEKYAFGDRDGTEEIRVFIGPILGFQIVAADGEGGGAHHPRRGVHIGEAQANARDVVAHAQ